LPDLIQRFVDEFADRFGVRTQFQYDRSPVRLTHRVEAEVLRIAQEAFNNVYRHADATLIQVMLEARDGFLTLAVIDNGKGFDPSTIGDGAYGLAGMRERAALINARLTIESRPLDGTRVTIQVPVLDAIPFEQRPR
jgi:two-component system sensor histidine kinase DegS